MKPLWAGLLLGAAAASVPFAWLVHRFVTGRDLRSEGSGNPGATNVYRAIGPAWGALAVALDAGKGALAAWVACRLFGAIGGIGAAIGAVLGHIYTPWLSGRGGRGVAPAAGAFLVVAPGATAAAAAVFGIVLVLTRLVSLGSVLAAIALPFAILLLGPARDAAVAAAVVAVAIAWRHRENFARMRAGTEPRAHWGAPPRGSARS